MKTRGLIIGKFLPPHRGHQYLIDFGTSYVDELVVMVCSIEREPIPGDLRFQWVRDFFQEARVVHHSEEIPQEPKEHPDFWAIWQRAICKCAGEQIDYVFASEDYGWKLAEVLGAQYVPVNHERSLIPISATKIRNDPFQYWDFILPTAQPHFLKRVAILGPESAGKTTLAKQLAQHYQTIWVEEYARGLLNFTKGWCEEHHIPQIALGQRASEAALADQASRLIFSDTDILTTTVWSELLFHKCPQWIHAMAAGQKFDLTLLLDCDLDWENDGQRYMPEESERQRFLEKLKAALHCVDRPYTLIQGRGEDRLNAAIREIDRRFLERPTPTHNPLL